ncbi:tRNA 2-thiouridine(34) synthase MnmA [Dermabacteraceae bacterium TAE3-ERU5]|nr:tRNA 2-thiouridine(34) synthase MnmA [Dermabacteraceae bacterium TAE3-ERU5]
MKVLAAMSGGVDSAVAAARAVDMGHEVVGVHMALSKSREARRTGSRGCCTVEDAVDARRVCDKLGIPYYVWDLSDDFEEAVIDDFLSEYRAGRTPNPCVRCNERIKFSSLLERARILGFDAVATGHYAHLANRGPDGSRSLHRAANIPKDQSYVLAVMGQENLAHAIFPLGDVADKEQVRQEAYQRRLGVSRKPDSYDICFIPDGDTQGFLRSRLGENEGELVTPDGEVLGTHRGTHEFTIGQRKGLGLERPAPDGKPRYVVEIRPESRQVVVGAETLLRRAEIAAANPVFFEPVRDGMEVLVQIRAHGACTPARAENTEDGFKVRLTEPLRGVAAGQTIVLYVPDPEGERVVACGTIR